MNGQDDASGVAYKQIDWFKVLAQRAAAGTVGALTRSGCQELPGIRGESVHIVRLPDGRYLASVIEGLGTKALVADAMRAITGKTYFDAIAQDVVAMIVNDMITLGALPTLLMMYAAAGSSRWFMDEERARDYFRGWTEACRISGCCWGPGESPALGDVLLPETCDLAGAAWGTGPMNHIFNKAILPNQHIVMLQSSGIHANGLTKARQVAASLPDGYATRMPNGRMYGEDLLLPTKLYVPLIRELQMEQIRASYGVNVTGHGWRKLMRASQPLAYHITKMPPGDLGLFRFIQEQSGTTQRDMYGAYNMGAGFALYFRNLADANRAVTLSNDLGISAWVAGRIRASDRRRVVIEPLGITFEEDELDIR